MRLVSTNRAKFCTAICTTVALAAAALATLAAQQPKSLIVNGDASAGLSEWTPVGGATVARDSGNGHFVVMDGGKLGQTITLPSSSSGQILVLVARGSSERVNADGSITGLPYLYGLIGDSSGVRILAHLQAPAMRARPQAPNTWVKMAGVFEIPDGAARLTVQLSQAERRGDPQNGSAARFDDVAAYVFQSESEARAVFPDLPRRTQVLRPAMAPTLR
jgi:hypothetical protein